MRPIVGAAVVFLLIGSVIFSVYYFAIAKPAAEELEREKLSALNTVNSLAGIGTSQASTAASKFATQIQMAGSKSEVNSILVEVSSAIQREQKRRGLLNKVRNAANGIYHSAANVPALALMAENLNATINAKTTLAELESYDLSGEIDQVATSTWRSYFNGRLSAIGENVVMKRYNSSTYWESISKENALALVGASHWSALRKLDFEGTTYVNVPITDRWGRAPTVKPNSVVNIYVYDTRTENIVPLYGNAAVVGFIASRVDFGNILWNLSYGDTTKTYLTDVFEAIKAAVAGSAEAAAINWQNYVATVLDRARISGIGQFDASIIYIVKVTEEAGKLILEYELHESATKDVILAEVA